MMCLKCEESRDGRGGEMGRKGGYIGLAVGGVEGLVGGFNFFLFSFLE
jgi:hypothetical protein